MDLLSLISSTSSLLPYMPSRTVASHPLRSPCKSKRGTKRPFDVKQPNAPPLRSTTTNSFIHPLATPFCLEQENESVSADYRGSFSRFSTSLLREKKEFRSIFFSLPHPFLAARTGGKRGGRSGEKLAEQCRVNGRMPRSALRDVY